MILGKEMQRHSGSRALTISTTVTTEVEAEAVVEDAAAEEVTEVAMMATKMTVITVVDQEVAEVATKEDTVVEKADTVVETEDTVVVTEDTKEINTKKVNIAEAAEAEEATINNHEVTEEAIITPEEDFMNKRRNTPQRIPTKMNSCE